MGVAAASSSLQGPLMLDLSGGLGAASGSFVSVGICWDWSSCLAFAQDGTSVQSSTGQSLCSTNSGTVRLSAACGTSEELLSLDADGGLRATTHGCAGMVGGGASVSNTYSAAVGVSPSYCPGAGADASSWTVWGNAFLPPGVQFQAQQTPSAGLAGSGATAYTRWSIRLASGSTAFRGGFGTEGLGLSATNPTTGAVVDFPASAYVQHSAWGGSSLFLVPMSQAEYSTAGSALLQQWNDAFPGASNANPITVVFGPATSQTQIDAWCDPATNARYTGYAASGASSYCHRSDDVDAGNEFVVAWHSPTASTLFASASASASTSASEEAPPAYEFIIDDAATSGSFVGLRRGGHSVASSVRVTALASDGTTYRLVGNAGSAQARSRRPRNARPRPA